MYFLRTILKQDCSLKQTELCTNIKPMLKSNAGQVDVNESMKTEARLLNKLI